jgi:ketosteroid isomerase-like protein
VADPTFAQQIRDLYAAFNRRDSAYVTDRMSPDVTWPRAFKGGVVQGPEAVRLYWEAQWSEIDPHVEPVAINECDDGRYDVEVHQVVKDLAGSVIADSTVHHVYTFDGPAIVSMELQQGD